MRSGDRSGKIAIGFSLPDFPSELLLQQAVARLLTLMPNVADVQILQGAQELGKDIVFRSLGPIGEPMNCACVIKNKPFSGKAGSPASLRVLLDQIEQALDTPYFDSRAEQQVIHQVYVINPHQITVAAMAACAGRLRSRAGQIKFVTGSELVGLFQRYWPDFLASESSLITQFSQELRDAAKSHQSLLNMSFNYQLGTVEKGTEHIYVPPCFKRTIILYALEGGCERALPKEWLSVPWGRETLTDIDEKCKLLVSFVEHIANWPFPGCESLASRNVDAVRQAHEALRLQARQALIEAFCDQSGAPRAKLSQINPKAQIKLSSRARSGLETWAEKAAAEVAPWCNVVRSALQRVREQVCALPSASPDILSLPAFLNACQVDDCLRAADWHPAHIIQTVHFPIDQGIHQRHGGSLLIVGGPGSGKTSFCTRNALVDFKAVEEKPSARLPVYVALHRVAGVGATTFSEMFLGTAGLSALLPDDRSRWQTKRLRVYLDGLDEIGAPDQRARILETAQQSQRDGLDAQVIITTRDYLYDPRLTWLPRIELSGLDDSGIGSLATQWLDNNEALTSEFMNQLNRLPGLKAITRVPLLATVTILVFKRTRRIPESRSRLYSTFVNLLCGGWDVAKGIVRPSRFDVMSKILVLSSLASELHQARERDFTSMTLQRVAKRVIGKRSAEETEALVSEVVADGLVTHTGDRYCFAHLTFQEFLTAKERLGDPSYGRIQAILDRYVHGDDWWREVLAFFIGLSENPELISQWLLNRMPRPGSDSRCDLLYSAFQEAFPDSVLELRPLSRMKRQRARPSESATIKESRSRVR